ncbi:MAG: hypothetical protein ACYDGO_05580 [Smithellaceae bacterium]
MQALYEARQSEENAALKQQIRKLEKSEADLKSAEQTLRESEEKYLSIPLLIISKIFA